MNAFSSSFDDYVKRAYSGPQYAPDLAQEDPETADIFRRGIKETRLSKTPQEIVREQEMSEIRWEIVGLCINALVTLSIIAACLFVLINYWQQILTMMLLIAFFG